jgi:hypothetical protein
LANDHEEGLVISEVNGAEDEGTLTIAEDSQTILYSPAEDFLGVARFQYTAQNQQGETSQASIEVLVRSPHQNPKNRFDTDGYLAPLDALFGINRLNEKGIRKLTSADETIDEKLSYLDVNGDGLHSSGDILETINQLNADVLAEGEDAASALVDTISATHLDIQPAAPAVATSRQAEVTDRDSEESLALKIVPAAARPKTTQQRPPSRPDKQNQSEEDELDGLGFEIFT